MLTPTMSVTLGGQATDSPFPPRRLRLPRSGTKSRRCLELWFELGGELQFSEMLREYCRTRDCSPRYANVSVQRILKKFGTKDGERGSHGPWRMREDVLHALRMINGADE